ncbi:hypothetical protein IAT40_003136 [Kwoniella sp. CBS 6097]
MGRPTSPVQPKESKLKMLNTADMGDDELMKRERAIAEQKGPGIQSEQGGKTRKGQKTLPELHMRSQGDQEKKAEARGRYDQEEERIEGMFNVVDRSSVSDLGGPDGMAEYDIPSTGKEVTADVNGDDGKNTGKPGRPASPISMNAISHAEDDRAGESKERDSESLTHQTSLRKTTPTAQHRPCPLALPLTPPKYSAPAYNGLPKYWIPSRRPKGWISSLNHHPRVVSDLSPKGKLSLTPPRASSTSVLPARSFDDQDNIENKDLIQRAPGQRITSVHARTHSQSGQGGSNEVRGGRRVSGAMQYAIAPIRHVSSAPSDLELYPADDRESGDARHSSSEEEVLEDGDTSLNAEHEAQIRYDVGLAQDQDEVWMAYVRAQLGALFPDFFDADPISLNPQARAQAQAQAHGGSRVSSGAYLAHTDQDSKHSLLGDEEGQGHSENEDHDDHKSQLGDVFTSSTPANTSFGMTDDTSSLATPLSSAAGMLRGNVSIPNVREEISGLREEIMRLRSVVGGLAEGMGRPTRVENVEQVQERPEVGREVLGEGATATDSAVLDDEVEAGGTENTPAVRVPDVVARQDGSASTEEVASKGELSGNTDEDQKQAEEKKGSSADLGSNTNLPNMPESFKQTAGISAEIIRTLDRLLTSSQRDSTEKTLTDDLQDKDKDKDKDEDKDKDKARTAAETFPPRDDATVFSPSNLRSILDYVNALKAPPHMG